MQNVLAFRSRRYDSWHMTTEIKKFRSSYLQRKAASRDRIKFKKLAAKGKF